MGNKATVDLHGKHSAKHPVSSTVHGSHTLHADMTVVADSIHKEMGRWDGVGNTRTVVAVDKAKKKNYRGGMVCKDIHDTMDEGKDIVPLVEEEASLGNTTRREIEKGNLKDLDLAPCYKAAEDALDRSCHFSF